MCNVTACHAPTPTKINLEASKPCAIPDFVRLCVDSDSMSPTLEQGDEVLVKVGARPELDGSGLYVFRYAGRPALVIRRVFITWDLQVHLIPDNSRYGTEVIGLDELSAVPCLGKVHLPRL